MNFYDFLLFDFYFQWLNVPKKTSEKKIKSIVDLKAQAFTLYFRGYTFSFVSNLLEEFSTNTPKVITWILKQKYIDFEESFV